MACQATRLRAQPPLPGARIGLACAVGPAAAVTPYLSTYRRGRSSEALCDPPYRPTGGNAPRNLFALLKPQRYQSPPAWRWSNPSIASQDTIDAAIGTEILRVEVCVAPAIVGAGGLGTDGPGPGAAIR